ncbi:MAG: oxidoreductase [Dehalococcoidia bacterium]|nr:oxidoreductase [Dehalococcoidia bacterium]
MGVDVTLTRIRQETPTVKSFLFDLGGEPFTFKPGQWVDFYIDLGYKMEVGGFSVISSPLQRGAIELAVKRQSHGVPSLYLHDKAKVGDSFIVDGGFGPFYYDDEMEKGAPVVLIAGGVGITPMMSILRYVDEAHPEVEATLLYSASTPSELAFRPELEAMAARNPQVQCIFTVTHPEGEPWEGRVGRIALALLKAHLPQQKAWYFICGPPAMLDDTPPLLEQLGVEPSRIRMERWW